MAAAPEGVDLILLLQEAVIVGLAVPTLVEVAAVVAEAEEAASVVAIVAVTAAEDADNKFVYLKTILRPLLM